MPKKGVCTLFLLFPGEKLYTKGKNEISYTLKGVLEKQRAEKKEGKVKMHKKHNKKTKKLCKVV